MNGMSTTRRTRGDLLALATGYANRTGAPVQTIIKELIHYEVLYSLSQTAAARKLVFQGGTALRLVYAGNRYSEDLDFVGGTDFSPNLLEPFVAVLKKEIAEAYGLEVEVGNKDAVPYADGLSVHRWTARIVVPQADRSVRQRQVINLEVANIPAHRPETVLVTPNYPHLLAPFRNIALRAESLEELLADKVKALVTRPFLKARDVWDIRFLVDQRIELDGELLSLKLRDYGWTLERFREAAELAQQRLASPKAVSDFKSEMSRFLDAGVVRFFDDAFARKYLDLSSRMIDKGLMLLEQQLDESEPALR